MTKISFVIYGCRLNKAESEELKRELSPYFFITSKNADIYIVNTCAVTNAAYSKCRSAIIKLIALNSTAKIIIYGCAASNLKKDGLPAYQYFFKSDQAKLSKYLIQKYAVKKNKNNSYISVYKRPLIKIQDGCSNYCSYCAVPYLRTAAYNKPLKDIVETAQKYEQNNYSEVVLTGLNIGKYHFNDMNLADVLEVLIDNTKKIRIRISSINPEDINDGFVRIFNNNRICNYLHLSLQSGSDDILKKMNRSYSSAEYYNAITRLKKVKQNLSISTDVIVGFPSESDEDFDKTYGFIEKCDFTKIHVFRYSPKKGTVAASMPNQVQEKIKKERAERLNELSSRLHKSYLEKQVGRRLSVIFEKKKNNYCIGTAANFAEVRVKTNQPLDLRICNVQILQAADSYLLGELFKA